MMVEYRSVVGFPMFRVGSDGTVWRWLWGSRRWRQLKGSLDRDGYVQVLLRKEIGGKKYGTRVHRLVLEAFVGPCPEGMEACHFPDRTRTNNNLSNLSWGTVSDNRTHRLIHGTFNGDNVPWSKLTEKQVRKIRRLAKTGDFTNTELAVMFGVSDTNIGRIVRGLSWRRQLLYVG